MLALTTKSSFPVDYRVSCFSFLQEGSWDFTTRNTRSCHRSQVIIDFAYSFPSCLYVTAHTMSKLIHASGVSPLPCRYLSQWIFRWDCMASNRRVWSSVRGLSPSQLVSVMKRLNMPNTWAVLTQSYSDSCDNRRSVPVDEGPCWEMWPAGASEADYSNRWCILKPGYSQDHGIHFRLSSLHCSETRYVQDIYTTWGPGPYTDLFLPCYPLLQS